MLKASDQGEFIKDKLLPKASETKEFIKECSLTAFRLDSKFIQTTSFKPEFLKDTLQLETC